jgi:hypothetical protein
MPGWKQGCRGSDGFTSPPSPPLAGEGSLTQPWSARSDLSHRQTLVRMTLAPHPDQDSPPLRGEGAGERYHAITLNSGVTFTTFTSVFPTGDVRSVCSHTSRSVASSASA